MPQQITQFNLKFQLEDSDSETQAFTLADLEFKSTALWLLVLYFKHLLHFLNSPEKQV